MTTVIRCISCRYRFENVDDYLSHGCEPFDRQIGTAIERAEAALAELGDILEVFAEDDELGETDAFELDETDDEIELEDDETRWICSTAIVIAAGAVALFAIVGGLVVDRIAGRLGR